jgi:hypothetical protein
MMNKTEQRFEAAKAAMQGILSSGGGARRESADDIAKASFEIADALLAELARTEPAEHHIPDATKMVPDADGWVVRIPTDPIPERHNGVRFADGLEMPDDDLVWTDEAWRHQKRKGSQDLHITHYRPA